MHKRCRAIMDELILSGELEEITWFKFAPKQELKLRLKDMLEDEVDKKYHLSQEAISYMGRDRQGKPRWEFHKNEVDGIAACLTANMHKGVPYGVITPHLPIRLEQTHILNIKGNDSIKRIYSSDGLCPSLTTMQGGHREPKVSIEKEIIKLFDIPKEILNDNERQRRVYSPEGISPAVIARSDSAKILQNTNSKIAHPVREVGRRLDENGKRCDDNKDIPITRRYEIGEKEISNCLSGVQKDSYVAIANGVIEIENDEVRVREAVAKGFTLATEGDSINISVPSSKTRRGRVGKQVAQTLDTACNQVVFSKVDSKYLLPKERLETCLNSNHSAQRVYCPSGIAPTISAGSNGGGKEPVKMVYGNEIVKGDSEIKRIIEIPKKNYIFRKLTPRECFRLQGFDDSFIFAPKMSDSQLYKQAGNGMSRNILDMIFTQIFTCYAKHIENKQN